MSLAGISAVALPDELPGFPDTTKPQSSATSFPRAPNCMQLLLIALPGEHRQGVLGNLMKRLAHTVAVGTFRGSTKVFSRLGVRAGPWAFFPYFP